MQPAHEGRAISARVNLYAAYRDHARNTHLGNAANLRGMVINLIRSEMV